MYPDPRDTVTIYSVRLGNLEIHPSQQPVNIRYKTCELSQLYWSQTRKPTTNVYIPSEKDSLTYLIMGLNEIHFKRSYTITSLKLETKTLENILSIQVVPRTRD